MGALEVRLNLLILIHFLACLRERNHTLCILGLVGNVIWGTAWMATAEYFRKQADLYSLLAGTTTDEEMRLAYLGHALDFLAKAGAAADAEMPPAHIIEQEKAGEADSS
jgi:hypothetical protein